MDFDFLINGIIIGFSIAAPIGPIGVLCIRRTLAEGRAYGLISGLGAATADAIYGCIAGFGLTFISNFLIRQQVWLSIVGGIFLCFLGVKTFLSKPVEQVTAANQTGLINSYASTFLLTLTNPVTILFFLGIFAGLGVGSTCGNYASAATLILGVFTGSALWWLTLSESVNLFRRKLTTARLRWVNRISGMVIAAFGVIALLSVIAI